RENGGNPGGDQGRRTFSGEPADLRPRDEQQEHPHERQHDSRRRFEEHVPTAHQIERRQEVTIEPALREENRKDDESDACQCDEPFRNRASAPQARRGWLTQGKNSYSHSAGTMLDVAPALDVALADVCWFPIGAAGSIT